MNAKGIKQKAFINLTENQYCFIDFIKLKWDNKGFFVKFYNKEKKKLGNGFFTLETMNKLDKIMKIANESKKQEDKNGKTN